MVFFHGLILFTFFYLIVHLTSFLFLLYSFFFLSLFPLLWGLHDTTNGVNRVLGVTRKTDAYLPIPSGSGIWDDSSTEFSFKCFIYHFHLLGYLLFNISYVLLHFGQWHKDIIFRPERTFNRGRKTTANKKEKEKKKTQNLWFHQ
jgi:hypothetical protein